MILSTLLFIFLVFSSFFFIDFFRFYPLSYNLLSSLFHFIDSECADRLAVFLL